MRVHLCLKRYTTAFAIPSTPVALVYFNSLWEYETL